MKTIKNFATADISEFVSKLNEPNPEKQEKNRNHSNKNRVNCC
jgi:hypothetical protein